MRSCHTCGSPVTADFARVFGSNDDEVYACPNCATFAGLMQGEAVSPRTR